MQSSLFVKLWVLTVAALSLCLAVVACGGGSKGTSGKSEQELRIEKCKAEPLKPGQLYHRPCDEMTFHKG